MPRTRFRLCRHCGDLHQLNRWPDNCREDPWPRSDLPAPYVVSDTLGAGVNGLYHHGVNQRFDSKAAYRRATKEAGYIEVGTERHHERRREITTTPERELEAAVAETIQYMEQKGLTADEPPT